jgi:hypothetical protein
MQDDAPDQVPETAPEAATPAATKRAEMQREKFRVAQQRARSEAAGGRPSEAEASRMLAEFHARGGQVTVCAPAEDTTPGVNINRDQGR